MKTRKSFENFHGILRNKQINDVFDGIDEQLLMMCICSGTGLTT